MAPSKVGDKVKYVPHSIHAHQMNKDGFPFVFGWKEGKNVKQLTQDEALLKLKHIKKQPASHAANERAKLVPLHCHKPWDAVVTAVNEDGSLNLDISDPTTGATLHYPGVKIDPTARAMHSCHCCEEKKEQLPVAQPTSATDADEPTIDPES